MVGTSIEIIISVVVAKVKVVEAVAPESVVEAITCQSIVLKERCPEPSSIRAVDEAARVLGVENVSVLSEIGFATVEEAKKFLIPTYRPVRLKLSVWSNEALCQLGADAAPFDVRSCPEEPKPVTTFIPLVVSPKRTWFDAKVVVPVPPLFTAIAVAFHVPDVIVPTVEREERDVIAPTVTRFAALVKLGSVVILATDVVPTSIVLARFALYRVGKFVSWSLELTFVKLPYLVDWERRRISEPTITTTPAIPIKRFFI